LNPEQAIRLELELFNPALKDKPFVAAYNKIDVPDSGDYWELVRRVGFQGLTLGEGGREGGVAGWLCGFCLGAR
jgi:hypothetical protein